MTVTKCNHTPDQGKVSVWTDGEVMVSVEAPMCPCASTVVGLVGPSGSLCLVSTSESRSLGL
jgi:hypothetical protein